MCLFHADIKNVKKKKVNHKLQKYVHILYTLHTNLAVKSWSWKCVIFHNQTSVRHL